MKKILLTFVVIGAITLTGYAQTPTTTATKTKAAGTQKGVKATETPDQKAQAAVDKLDKTVTLTADQKTQIKALAVTKFTNVDAIRAKYKGQADKKEVEKKEIQGAQKDYRDGLKKILTADQVKKMEDAEKAAKESKTNSGGTTKPTTTTKPAGAK